MSEPDVVVIAWYRKEDYPRMLALASNGGGMEPTFEAWERFVSGVLPAIYAQGRRVEKVVVDPDQFAAWLKEKHLKSTPETRAQFVLEIGSRRLGTH